MYERSPHVYMNGNFSFASRGPGVQIPSAPPRGYRQNCRCRADRTASVTVCSMPAGSDRGCLVPCDGVCRGPEPVSVFWRVLGRGCPAGWAWSVVAVGAAGLSAVWEVVAQAGAPPACPLGEAGLAGGGCCPPRGGV